MLANAKAGVCSRGRIGKAEMRRQKQQQQFLPSSFNLVRSSSFNFLVVKVAFIFALALILHKSRNKG